MQSILCPGCGKEHTLAHRVAAPLKKRCLRCAQIFEVAPERVRKGKAMVGASVGRAEATAAPVAPVDGEPIPEAPLLPDPEPSSSRRSEEALGDAESPKSRRGRKKRSRVEKKVTDVTEALAEDANPAAEAATTRVPTGRRSLWPMVLGLTAVGVLAGGVAWYLLFGKGDELANNRSAAKTTETTANAGKTQSSKEQTKDAGKTAKKNEASATPASGEQQVAMVGPPAPPKPTRSLPAIRLSAARLAAELANNAAEAKRKYVSRTLQVSGLFERMEAARLVRAESDDEEPDGKPAEAPAPDIKPPLAVFAAEGAPLVCDLEDISRPYLHVWAALRKGQPVTIKGKFGTDLKLHNCELLPLAAPADERYLGKELEIVGYVSAFFPVREDRPYPTLKLEPNTNGRVDVECLFPKADEAELRKMQLGALVTLSTVCSGRRSPAADRYQVRFDNCRLIYTTAPVPPTLRLNVAQILTDYEEDLRVALLPSPDAGSMPPITMAQLATEFLADKNALAKKYSNRILTVSGTLHEKRPQLLILESGSTNHPLRMQCFFTQANFRKVEDRKTYAIRGLCGGMMNPQVLRLDNCEMLDPSAPAESRTITADYLPLNPGQTLTYDVATLRPDGGGLPSISRRVLSCAQEGMITSWTTHSGRLPAGAMIDPHQHRDWISSKKAKKVAIEGAVYQRRIFAGFIEIGQKLTNRDGTTALEWQQVLKLGAGSGDSWRWTQGGAHHQFTVLKFAEHKGKSSVVIKETLTRTAPPEQYFELQHVYIKDVGEVERQESVRQPSGQMRVVTRMTLVDEEDLAPPGVPKVSLKNGKAGSRTPVK